MTVNLYVSDGLRGQRQYGFLAPSTPISLLPRNETWKYVRSGETSEFGLPEAIEDEIRRKGFWALWEGYASSPQISRSPKVRRSFYGL